MVTVIQRRHIMEAPPDSADDIQVYDWRATASIVREKSDGTKQYLKQATMQDLLGQLADNVPFRLKSLRNTENLGNAEFYRAIQWMRGYNLVAKTDGGYVIPSIDSVKRKWRQIISEEGAI